MKASDVTVVIPAWNAASSIDATLESILAQTAGQPDIIVCDDGSTDATAAVIDSFGREVRRLSGPQGGPAVARNRGIAQAQSELVAFCDADDRWPPSRLNDDLAQFASKPHLDVLLGRTRFDAESPELLAGLHFNSDNSSALIASFGAATMRRAVFERTGRIDSSMRHYEDYDWFLRVRELGLGMIVHDRISQWRRIHTASMSRRAPATTAELLTLLRRSVERRHQEEILHPLPRLSDLRDTR
jgi:glycosyltransferase involved in cell wall biosynthesis